MATAVQNYARYRVDSHHSWMLGRFILPVSRLAEFEHHFKGDRGCWHISALMGGNPDAELSQIQDFNSRYRYGAQIDCIEVKVTSPDQVEKLHRAVASGITAYYEVPLSPDLPTLLDAIKRVNGRAKIRTGGVTPDAFPSSEAVANFLMECAERELPFKATAGLHHPLRCLKPLTYEPNAPTGTMYGFLNIFLAAVLAHDGTTPQELAAMLNEDDPSVFSFEDIIARWRDCCLELEGLIDTRQNFAISFGSCSFEEPIADLKALNLL